MLPNFWGNPENWGNLEILGKSWKLGNLEILGKTWDFEKISAFGEILRFQINHQLLSETEHID